MSAADDRIRLLDLISTYETRAERAVALGASTADPVIGSYATKMAGLLIEVVGDLRGLMTPQPSRFKRGDTVRKTRGSNWHGTVVGEYSTALTPEGYAVESWTEKGSVQIYPASALEPWTPEGAS